ncbi:hypothetical protein X975_06599, partial [Stegodyphus mimosarum]
MLRSRVSGFVDLDGLGMEFNISRALAFSSGLISLDLGTETMMISYVVNLSVDSVSISVTIAALDIAVSISVLSAVLFEFTVVTVDFVSVLVGDGLSIILMAITCTAISSIMTVSVLSQGSSGQGNKEKSLEHNGEGRYV